MDKKRMKKAVQAIEQKGYINLLVGDIDKRISMLYANLDNEYWIFYGNKEFGKTVIQRKITDLRQQLLELSKMIGDLY